MHPDQIVGLDELGERTGEVLVDALIAGVIRAREGAQADAVDARLASALKKYTETRHKDLIAISDLAMAN